MATPAPAKTTASAAPATAATAKPAATTTNVSAGATTAVAGAAILYWIGLAIFLILFHVGAAKLSYDLNQSALWAFVSFLFASLYYPYYAFVYSARRETSSFFGGRKRR